MKTVRWLTLVIVLAIVFSTWAPTAVLAKPAAAGAGSVEAKAKSTVVKLSLTNKTGGTIYLSLSGEGRAYSFASSTQGKVSFEIQPGKYTYTLSTSACRGSVTKTRSFKAGSASLGSWICRR